MSLTAPSARGLSAPATGGIVLDDYESFCAGLQALCGVDLTQYRRSQMERRLRTYFERRGVTRLAAALPELGRHPAELAALLDRVTINVTQLWRHPAQFAHLAAVVIPELAAQSASLRVWSAGSSYGAEAYTLAAVCRASAPHTSVSVLGTDIDRRMVERARAGWFSSADARGVPSATMEAAFERDGEGWRARSELRAMVRFEVGDLLRLKPRAGHDLVVCRNTVIYFSEPVRDELHRRLTASLRPGGYLLVGAAERVAGPSALGLEPLAPFFYRKA